MYEDQIEPTATEEHKRLPPLVKEGLQKLADARERLEIAALLRVEAEKKHQEAQQEVDQEVAQVEEIVRELSNFVRPPSAQGEAESTTLTRSWGGRSQPRASGLSRRDEVVLAMAKLGKPTNVGDIHKSVMIQGENKKSAYNAVYTLLGKLAESAFVEKNDLLWKLTPKGVDEAAKINEAKKEG